MEERSLAELQELQVSRGGDALVRVGKPLRRYARPKQETAGSAGGRGRQGRVFRPCLALNLRALERLRVERGLLDAVELDERTPASGFTAEGDIVISLATPHAAACMDADRTGLFVPSSCASIHIDRTLLPEVDPWYVTGCLTLPSVLETLDLAGDGRKSTLANVEQVTSIRIPWCGAEEQRAVGEAVRAHARVIDRLRRIESLQHEALAAAIARAARMEEAS